MKFNIESPGDLGEIIRASRKAMGLRQDDAAGSIGVSENFLGKVERGGETVQWGKLFQVIQELGLAVSVEVPEPYAQGTQATLSKRRQQQTTQPTTVQVTSPHGERT
ncbi:TPA: helix-turn-helix transcriptional regulator [Pseudomonas aeruginosa]|nr:helix-turn-helix transcriptional regulator [Pseudomonas aeruginosa]HBO2581256.1 helix-turn-helix transcriptional regulator [Pseudomonas aeruginosa]HBO2600065.1 helix-turn-helix transcriptional regulator [Pseudomonas aeruginosa]HCK0545477.1 helix-turn-helix transcriptional regulator [Pseudomonas aeruginosa]HEP7917648.1 helix-turn-helix transcriptional regulator [Pseudomonas aeruginosa]